MANSDTITSAFTMLNMVVQEKKRIDAEMQARQEAERLARIEKNNQVRDGHLARLKELIFQDAPSILASPHTETADVNPVIRAYCKMFSGELDADQYEKLEVYSKKIITSEPNESAYINARRKIEPEFGLDAIKNMELLRTIYIGTSLPSVKRVMQDGLVDDDAIVHNLDALLEELKNLPTQISERLISDIEIREIKVKLIKATMFSLTLVDETIKSLRTHLETKHPEKMVMSLDYFTDGLNWAPDALAYSVFNAMVEECSSLRDALDAETANTLFLTVDHTKEKMETRVTQHYGHDSLVA